MSKLPHLEIYLWCYGRRVEIGFVPNLGKYSEGEWVQNHGLWSSAYSTEVELSDLIERLLVNMHECSTKAQRRLDVPVLEFRVWRPAMGHETKSVFLILAQETVTLRDFTRPPLDRYSLGDMYTGFWVVLDPDECLDDDKQPIVWPETSDFWDLNTVAFDFEVLEDVVDIVLEHPDPVHLYHSLEYEHTYQYNNLDSEVES